MALSTQVIGTNQATTKMVKVFRFGLMEVYTRGTGRMTKQTAEDD
jgi:hypothetical protein